MSDQPPPPTTVDVERFRELLGRLEQHWRRAGAPIAQTVAPGRDVESIESVFASIGLPLPVEVREWFAWHDGYLDRSEWGPAVEVRAGPEMIGGVRRYDLLSLDDAVRDREMWLEVIDSLLVDFEADGVDPDELWAPTWFPLASMPSTLAVDCAVAEGAPAPVRVADTHVSAVSDIVAPSLTAVVELWVDLLDRGIWTYDDEHAWQVDLAALDRLDPRLRFGHLAF